MRIDISKFAGQKDLFNYLLANKSEIIAMKKNNVLPKNDCNKNSDGFGIDAIDVIAHKALTTSFTDNLESGIVKRSFIANTYNWMDSHSDVHADGVFSKSLKESSHKIYHLADHEFKTTARVGKFESIIEQTVMWNSLGIQKFGHTQILLATSNVEKEMSKSAFKDYAGTDPMQHSVGMIYEDIVLAVNDPEMKSEYAEWNKVIDKVGNKEKAMQQGYFFVVKVARLKEISVVLEGSNELTGTLDNKIAPVSTTQKDTPSEQDTLNARKKINYLIY